MMQSTKQFIGVLLAISAVGCGASSEPETIEPEPERFAMTMLSPAEIKANYSGDLYVSGAGFVAGDVVLVDGTPVTAIPGASMSVVDENTIRVSLTYGGPGSELIAGDYAVQVEKGTQRTATKSLHVRPILAKFSHIRSYPGLFLRNGGFLDIWVSAIDSEDLFIGAGTELGGANGLDDTNFMLSNVRFTRTGTTTPISPDVEGVADVIFEPVGTAKPLAIALTIDQSGSMIGLGSNPVPSDPNDERVTQSQAFVDRIGAMDEVKVMRFNGEAGAVFDVVAFTGDKTALKAGLEGLRTTEGGNTPLFDAMLRSVNDVAAKGANVTKGVVILTDGRDTTSTTTEAQVITAARNAGVPIFSIGLGNPNDALSLDRASLQRIADQTGGRVFFAEDPTALSGIFDGITQLLADSYRLEAAVSFEPPLSTAGTYKLEGDLVVEVDGEAMAIPMIPINVSVVN